MPQQIDVPNVGLLEFPDGMSDTDMSAAIERNFSRQMRGDAPMTAAGAYKAFDVGAQEGVAGLASLPRTVGTLGAQGIQGAANWVSSKLGIPEDTRDLEKQKGVVELPTYESALKTIQDPKGMFGGQPYTPQNTGEEYLRTLGQFAPNVAFGGGGGLVRGVVAPALASETAGQLTKGYGAEPYARMAGAVLGAGAASGLANTARTARGYRGVPTLEDVGPAVDQGYTAARTAGVELNPSYVSRGLSDITRGLTSGPNARSPRLIEGTLGLIDDEAKALAPAAMPAPGAMAALTKVAPAAPAARPPVDFTRLDALRRDLGEVARDFTNPTEQAAARIAQTKIDDLLEAAGKTPGAVLRGDADLLAQTAREARANAAAEFRMRALEAVRQRAEDQAGAAHSGRNVENAYRQQLKAFVRPDNKGISPAQRAGLSRDEITEIRQATRGTSFPNLLRTFGNILGGGGGIATGGLGAAGYLSGDPRFYAAAGLGFGARNLSNALMRSRANYLNRMVGARSPLAQQTGFTQPGPMIDATRPSLLSLLPAYLPGRQAGGPVEEDRPYLVGEDGSEVFVPDDPWARAAARTGHRGRQEGAGTRFVEGGYGIPAAYRALDRSAQDAFESAGSLQRGGSYDPAPVVAQALGAVGAPLVGPAQAGAVLGAGAVRRAAPEVVKIGRRAPEGGGVYPGIYRNPKEIAAEAAAQVAPEHPAMKELFGVTRDDLYQIGQEGRRAGNREPSIAAVENPKGSYVAEGVINRANEGRILDAMKEAEKYPEFVKGMDSWYVMDPAFRRMVELVGPQQAIKDYQRFNTLTSMASPGSEVLTEINRGTAANMMAARGEFPTFQKYGGMAAANRGADFPAALRDVIGHPYHSTAQAGPMGRYLESGVVDMTQPKVPLYLQASGVPETGFQTRLPVPDAHFARALGVADVRRNANPGASMKTPEYAPIGPWFREKIAKQAGVEAVPGQARMWGLFSPQTGVDTPIGAPKLELLAQRIWERAQQLGVDPKKLRDDVLSGKAHASWLLPGLAAPGLMRGEEE